jgi:hypothetical protein
MNFLSTLPPPPPLSVAEFEAPETTTDERWFVFFLERAQVAAVDEWFEKERARRYPI